MALGEATQLRGSLLLVPPREPPSSLGGARRRSSQIPEGLGMLAGSKKNPVSVEKGVISSAAAADLARGLGVLVEAAANLLGPAGAAPAGTRRSSLAFECKIGICSTLLPSLPRCSWCCHGCNEHRSICHESRRGSPINWDWHGAGGGRSSPPAPAACHGSDGPAESTAHGGGDGSRH